MTRPEGMTGPHFAALGRLGPDLRLRVEERAALLFEGGMSWPEADAEALRQEAPQRQLFGEVG